MVFLSFWQASFTLRSKCLLNDVEAASISYLAALLHPKVESGVPLVNSALKSGLRSGFKSEYFLIQ